MAEAAVEISAYNNATALSSEKNFFLQQIRLKGLSAGIASGAFSTRPKDLTDKELAERARKWRDDLRGRFEDWVVALGEEITVIREELDDVIADIDKKLKLFEKLEPSEIHPDAIKQLKEDKKTLIQQREALDEIDQERLSADPDSAERIQSKFEKFKTYYSATMNGLGKGALFLGAAFGFAAHSVATNIHAKVESALANLQNLTEARNDEEQSVPHPQYTPRVVPRVVEYEDP